VKPKVFVVQPIPEVALDAVRQAADVSVYPYMDRQISVDEPEPIRASREKEIADAALSVCWNEPYRNNSPFTPDLSVPEQPCKLDNIILASHNGGATWDIRGRKAASVAHSMVAMMRGERPAARLNPEIYASA
jgi:phosphoglycerate dehydrogenase-like enzyme